MITTDGADLHSLLISCYVLLALTLNVESSNKDDVHLEILKM
jgi:hypothetical protein